MISSYLRKENSILIETMMLEDESMGKELKIIDIIIVVIPYRL